jgi:hypothetical protein
MVVPGSEVVEIPGAAATVMEKSFVAVALVRSTTCIVNVDEPAVVGVPVMAPVPEPRLSPAGSDPENKDQVSGALPPIVSSVWEYPLPTIPPGNEFVLMENGASTAIDRSFESVAFVPSMTRMVKLGTSVVVGVPVIAPVAVSRLSPAGKAPAETDQVYGRVPPVALTVWEYAQPIVASGNDEVPIVTWALSGAAKNRVAMTMQKTKAEDCNLTPQAMSFSIRSRS